MASAERQGWDTRAWKTGLISSNMCGLLLAIAAITERSHPGRGALTLHHYGAGYALGLLATLIANFVLPAILTLISRRKFLFWGLLCPLIFAGWALSTRYLRGQTYHLHRDMITIPFLIFLSLILHLRTNFFDPLYSSASAGTACRKTGACSRAARSGFCSPRRRLASAA